MNHFTDNDIDAYVQHKRGNSDYFSLSTERFNEMDIHLKACDICLKKVNSSDELYGSIQLKKNTGWYKYSAAAVILICFSIFSLICNDLNKDQFLTYHNFGFMNTRGEGTDSLKNAYSNLLLKKNYDLIIKDCKERGLTENNLHFIAALVFKAQDEDDKKKLLEVLKYMTSKDLEGLKTRIKKLME